MDNGDIWVCVVELVLENPVENLREKVKDVGCCA